MQVRATPQVKYNLALALSHLEEEEVSEARRLLREVEQDETLDEDSRRDARTRLEELGPEPEPTQDPAAAGTASTRGSIGDAFTGQRPFTLEAHVGFSFWGRGLVTGARVGIPLVHNLVPSLNNALYLSIGLDFYYVRTIGGYGPGLGVPVALHWELYFDEQWSAFLELGGQFFVHPLTFENDRFAVYEAGYWFLAAVGASFRVHEQVAITLRVGTPFASLAATFLF